MHVARPAGYVAGSDSAPAAVSLAVSRATAPPPAVHPVLDVVKQLPVPTRDLCLGNLLSDAIMSNATELAEVNLPDTHFSHMSHTSFCHISEFNSTSFSILTQTPFFPYVAHAFFPDVPKKKTLP